MYTLFVVREDDLCYEAKQKDRYSFYSGLFVYSAGFKYIVYS